LFTFIKYVQINIISYKYTIMAIKEKDNNVIISKKEYNALIQMIEVTDEYLDWKWDTFKTSDDLINNLKKL